METHDLVLRNQIKMGVRLRNSLTNFPQFHGALELLSSNDEEHSQVDARVERWLQLEAFSVPAGGNAMQNSAHSSRTRSTSAQRSRKHGKCIKVRSVLSPLYGVVPVFGVFAVRVQEDVFVYASTEAEHVRRRMFTRLQHLQHHPESLLPVPGTVPPAHKHGEGMSARPELCLTGINQPVTFIIYSL